MGFTHKFAVGQHEGYLTVGLYDNGQPGEIFITMAKEGSTVSGLMDSFATAVSLALQYGVPLKVLCDKFSHTRFEPSGWTHHPEIRYAKSVMDYIFRWLAWKFLPRDAQPREDASVQSLNGKEAEKATKLASQFTRASTETPPQSGFSSSMSQGGLVGVNQSDDAPSCADCGAIMVRNGACYKCLNCGSTSGCS
jgi:ribonucleoside-diphosphate reductase alpha chain